MLQKQTNQPTKSNKSNYTFEGVTPFGKKMKPNAQEISLNEPFDENENDMKIVGTNHTYTIR